ncbi:response regulator [Mobilicoccus pelagius]|uniref:Putative two-component response regulator n=1 Tax=Mobilicoccus pelagius NBRC 104925 TaxID=1089455 RepID=H5UVY2_9MICO|nr:response regulator transcription factor [Mobilicoccus pelagius]GAB49890.1 putative two-component response regulator [Mobilicoccus pelagius NBRC 104925]
MTHPSDATGTPPPIRVMIVDDHPVVRAGLRALLSTSGRIEVAAEAENGERALELLRSLSVDVVLMDLQMGEGMDGVTATTQIRAADGPPVLILTTYDTDRDIVRAVEAGAAGYLLKDAPPADLVEAVDTAARGETALAPRVAGRLLTRMRAPHAQLTGRELAVLGAVARGLTNRAVAKELFISEATVKTHLVHVYEKLGVDSRTGAVAAAREAGLIR